MRLEIHINAGNLLALPKWSAVPQACGRIDFAAISEAGFAGVQVLEFDQAVADAGLRMSSMARILDPLDVGKVTRRHQDLGFVATTLHLGTGFETDSEMDAYADAVVAASERFGYSLLVETHRATLTQDPARTLGLVLRYPELKFNADLSHWYTGQEMRYGSFDTKLDALMPVFERTRFMHGRVGNSCTMQMPLAHVRGTQAWFDYCKMWSLCVAGFLRTARRDETLIFAPELLPALVEHRGQVHQINYALLMEKEGGLEEVSDRWLEALELVDLMRTIWAQERMALTVASGDDL